MNRDSKMFIILATFCIAGFLAISFLGNLEGANEPSKTEVIQKTQRLQIPFIANKGQMDERVAFYANTFGGIVFVTKDGEIVYSLPLQDFGSGEKNKEEAQIVKGVTFKESLVGGKIDRVKGEEISTVTVNYFKGKAPSMWNGNISTYELVNFGEVYKGIDLRLKAYGNNVEKLFYVKPNADAGVIRLRLSGAKILTVNGKGQLEVEIDSRIVKFTKPVAYQENMGKRKEVAVNYSLSNSECSNSQPETIYGFGVDDYDRAKELVIDPLLASTYLGGASDDSGYFTAIDANGNIYVTGRTQSSNFPTTVGAYDTSIGGDYDVFVSKLNRDLTHLLASTYLGGASDDNGNSISINSAGDIYVAGQTSSSDFPVTAGENDTAKGGYSDAFISKLSNDLTHLLASTYLGGAHDDSADSTAIDHVGNIYVTGKTSSSDFPTTLRAYDTSYNGNDAFVSKLSGDLSRLLASTYLGGSDNEVVRSITMASDGSVYVAGETWSSDFPATIGAYDNSFNGGFGDAFISRLNENLTHLLASTFLGGSTDDSARSIAMDTGGNVYVTGQTESLDFPTTSGSYDTFFSNGDAFVSKVSGDLKKLLASTFLGGSDDDVGNSIAIGSDGSVYVAGYTASSDFPVTPDAYDTSKGVFMDACISKLSGDLKKLLASTFLGGYYRDRARSMAINSTGNIYVTGETRSSDFPTTPGACDISYNSDADISDTFDVFVSRFDGNLSASSTASTKDKIAK